MSTDTESVAVVLHGQDDGVAAMADATIQRMAALQDVVIKLTASTDANATSQAGAGSAIARLGALAETTARQVASVAPAESDAARAAEMLANHWRIASAAGEALGVEAAGLGAKLAAFGEVVGGIEGVFPPLVIGLVGLEAAMKGFEFLHEASDVASQFQSQMETLGASVEGQGGKWEAISASVAEFVAQESMATGFTRAQIIPSMNELEAAGKNWADTQTIIGVAEEVAIAHHRDLAEVTKMLTDVEVGRGIGLERLDARVKPLIDDHDRLSVVLQQLHKDSEKQVEADESAERANARLHSEIEGVQLAIGQKLLPVMAEMSYEFLGGLKNAEAFGAGVLQVFSSIVDSAHSVAESIAAIYNLADTSMDRDAKVKSHWDTAVKFAKQSHDEWTRGVGEMANEVFHGQSASDAGRNAAGDAVRAHMARLNDIHLTDDPAIGKEHAGPKAGSVTFTPADYHTEPVDKYAAAQKSLDDRLKDATKSEAALAEQIKTATTVEGQASAQAAYDSQVTVDLLNKQQMLTDAIKTQQHEHDEQAQKLKASEDASRKATDAYNAYGDAMLKSGDDSLPVQNHLAVLKTRMDDANKASDGFAKSVKELNADLDKNGQALLTVNAKLDEFKNKAAEVFAEASRKWDEYERKSVRSMQEDLDTWNKNNAQKLAYYTGMVADLKALDAQYATQAASAAGEQAAANASRDKGRIASADAAAGAISARYKQSIEDTIQADTKRAEAYKATLDEMRNLAKSLLQSDQQNAESRALFGASLADQLEYYQRQLASLDTFDHDYSAKYADLYAKIGQIREQAYEQWASREQGWLDGLIQHTRSVGDTLKDIWRTVFDDYAKQLEAAIIKSSLFEKLNAKLVPGGASATSPAMAALLDAQAKQTASTVTFTEKQTAATTAVGSATASLHAFTDALDQAASFIRSAGGGPDSGFGSLGSIYDGETGLPTNGLGEIVPPGWSDVNVSQSAIDAANASSTMDPLAGFNAGAYGPTDVNLASIADLPLAGGHGVPTDIKAINGSTLAAGAMQGLMIAQIVNGFTGGNSTWSDVGGAVGGAFYGPIGAAVGSAIGGLFGPHETKAQQPDINDPSWAQDDTDWNGAAGSFNGQNVSPQSQYDISNGMTSQGAQIAAWVKANSGNVSALSTAQQALYNQFLAIMGGDPNAGPGAYGIASESQGNVHFGSGDSESVTAFEQQLAQFGTDVGGDSSQTTPVFTVNRASPDWIPFTASQTGTFTTSQDGSTAYAPVSSSPTAGPSSAGGTSGGGGIVINFNKEVYGILPDDMKADILQFLTDAQLGIAPGVGSSASTMRRGG